MIEHSQYIDQDAAQWPVVTGETPATLLARWKAHRGTVSVIPFYQDGKGHAWREFSNWYTHKDHGFDFVLPLELLELAGLNDEQKAAFAPVAYCDNSEKALMLCKAAVMGDAKQYAKIAVAETPKEAKILGRHVLPWVDDRWRSVICGVAIAMLKQKFSHPKLREVLLSTGEKYLCEATAGDKTWAIGVSIKMPKVYEMPSRWKGSNVLGWALMEVRSILCAEDALADLQRYE